MLQRHLFASYQWLQQDRGFTTPAKVGTLVSLAAHAVLFAVVYTADLGTSWLWQTPTLTTPALSQTSDVVELYGRPLILPPEVVNRLLQQGPTREPAQADLIGERGTIAQGGTNPRARDSSQNPRGSSPAGSPPSGSSTMPQAGTQSPERAVVESATQAPTVASKPTPSRGAGAGGDQQLPEAGGATDLAQLNLPKRDVPAGVTSDEPTLVPRGPISLNVRGVGAIEEYRVYLQRAIQQRWQIPPEANLLDKTVSVTIEFVVAQDGRLVSVRLHRSSGIRALDRAAQRAIELAAPFRPLPRVFPGPTQVFTDTFVYYPPSGS